MFVRHLKKFNNAEEMQAAIAAGTIASPYVAFDASDNVTNLVIPADKEPASIDYQQEGDDPSTGEDPTLTFNYVDVTYNTVADFVPAIYGDTSYYDSVAFFIVEQSTIDDMFIEHPGWSHGDALWSLIESDTASVIEDASAGQTVSLASSLNAYYDSQNVYVFALLEHFKDGNRDFYQPIPTDDNYAFEAVQWAEAAPTTTYFSMYIASQGFDPNDSSTYNVNISFSGYPGDLSWPYVTFGAYKVTEMTPYADVTTMSNVLGQDYDYFPAGGSGTHTIEIAIDLQPGESAYYCVCGAPMNDMPSTEMMYVAYQQVLVTVPSDSSIDSSTDVSLGYKFTVGQDNTAYFNTGYVPGADTVVQLRGTIIDDGTVTHGIKTGHGEWQYRIFGYAGAVYYDRVDDDVRLNADEDLTVPHDYEFGNFYIKINGSTVANDTESDLTNFFTEQQLFVFAGSEQGAMGESIPVAYAAQGTQLEYFKILEPDGNGGLNLEKDLRPALDASGNICLYDQVSDEILYPEGTSVNIIATEIGGGETPDSSQGGDSSILVPATPAVEYDNYSDDGAGTIIFDAWLNADAIAAGAHHYSVGITSDAMMQTAMENAMMNSEEFDPDAWMIAQCYGTYTGDSAAPNSITLSYSTSFDDQGSVIAVMYDSGDNIIQISNGFDYQTIDGWSYSVPPVEEPLPEPEP